jgi:hypothetical protein
VLTSVLAGAGARAAQWATPLVIKRGASASRCVEKEWRWVAMGATVICDVQARRRGASPGTQHSNVELTVGRDGRLELRFTGKLNVGRPVTQMVLIDETGRVVAQLGSEMVHQLGR